MTGGMVGRRRVAVLFQHEVTFHFSGRLCYVNKEKRSGCITVEDSSADGAR